MCVSELWVSECVCVHVADYVLAEAVCVCHSPVLRERSEVRDLECVCVWLVVFLVNNSPRLFLYVPLHCLLQRQDRRAEGPIALLVS